MLDTKQTLLQQKIWDGCLTPEEKAITKGVESLSDSELLALVIRSGTRKKTAVQVCCELLAINHRQLLNIHELDVNDLMNIDGIGRVKALQLKAVSELSKRLVKTSFHRLLDMDAPETIARYYMEQMRHEQQEVLYTALFDIKGHFISDKMISKGTVNYAIISPREIFAFAIRQMAGYIIILHNHPSGSPQPSDRDNEATERIAKCGALLDIPLLDHIIIGDNIYYSYREHQQLR